KNPDANKSVVAAMYQTATFRYDTVEAGARLGAETGPGYFYTRWGNPTTDLFEQKMALLEGGEAALATSSGMAAIATAVMSLLRAGDHVVAPKAVYQATFGLFDSVLPAYGVEATLLDDPEVGAYERALRPSTRLLYIETPNNPLLGVVDIAGVVALARSRGARTIADNTFATPYNQTPLALGIAFGATPRGGRAGDAAGLRGHARPGGSGGRRRGREVRGGPPGGEARGQPRGDQHPRHAPGIHDQREYAARSAPRGRDRRWA